MAKKALNGNHIVTTSNREKREKLLPRFTTAQLGAIERLVPEMAGSKSEVVSRIVVMWLFEKNYLRPRE